MIIYPAIDIKEGSCVRLYKGDMTQSTIFNTSPSDQALIFEKEGAEWIHVVDLNGAFAGKSINEQAVLDILKSVKIPVQLGGGIRNLSMIENWLSQGLSRVILGTIAVKDPKFVKEACLNFPGKIAVGIDSRKGLVAIEGWAETSTMTAYELALKFEDTGVTTLIYTDIDRDGTLTGINIQATLELAHRVHIPIIASGGASSLDDIQALIAQKNKQIAGIIIGRALYDGRLTLKSALSMIKMNHA
jgi:phosphoribosylformimino-5-aminoimidazole carboxamide ribotide isomerase